MATNLKEYIRESNIKYMAPVKSELSKKLKTDATGITGATAFTNIVGISETDYNALTAAEQNNGTLYIRTGA